MQKQIKLSNAISLENIQFINASFQELLNIKIKVGLEDTLGIDVTTSTIRDRLREGKRF